MTIAEKKQELLALKAARKPLDEQIAQVNKELCSLIDQDILSKEHGLPEILNNSYGEFNGGEVWYKVRCDYWDTHYTDANIFRDGTYSRETGQDIVRIRCAAQDSDEALDVLFGQMYHLLQHIKPTTQIMEDTTKITGTYFSILESTLSENGIYNLLVESLEKVHLVKTRHYTIKIEETFSSIGEALIYIRKNHPCYNAP